MDKAAMEPEGMPVNDRSENLIDSPHRGLALGAAPRGYRGSIVSIEVDFDHNGVPASEIERRLLELGFVEGAAVAILHEGPVGRDPIAVRVNNTTIALRRREAMAIFVTANSAV